MDGCAQALEVGTERELYGIERYGKRLEEVAKIAKQVFVLLTKSTFYTHDMPPASNDITRHLGQIVSLAVPSLLFINHILKSQTHP